MFIRISHLALNHAQRGGRMCHQVHAAGLVPNGMNRFLFSNMQEVLFVN